MASLSKAAKRTETLAQFIERVAPAHVPIPPHLQGLVDLLERTKREHVRALVSMPPRHGKTETILTAFADRVVNFPHLTNAYVTFGSTLSHSKSSKIRRLAIGAGAKLQDDTKAKHEWRTTRGGGMLATGIGGSLTGQGVTGLLVVDDPFKNREEAESPLIRDKVIEWFGDVAYTRLEKGASCIVVATRWHIEDLIGQLERQHGVSWEVIKLPAINDAGEALWPDGKSLAELENIRAQIGEYGFASLYQQEPRPRGGKVFERDPARYLDPSINGARILLSLDGAGTEGTKSDYSVASAIAFKGSGASMTADVLEVWRAQLTPEHIAAPLVEFRKRHGNGELLIESTRDGKAIDAALRRIDPTIRTRLITPIGDKFTRAQPLAAAWNQGRVRIPMHAPWVPTLLDETSKFTGSGDRHDDQCDSLSLAWNHAVSMSTEHNVLHIPSQRRTARR